MIVFFIVALFFGGHLEKFLKSCSLPDLFGHTKRIDARLDRIEDFLASNYGYKKGDDEDG